MCVSMLPFFLFCKTDLFFSSPSTLFDCQITHAHCVLFLLPFLNQMVVLMDPNDDGKDVLRLHRSREKRYAFDRAYGTTCSQNEVYEGSCKFLLPGILEGYNGTVFAYVESSQHLRLSSSKVAYRKIARTA